MEEYIQHDLKVTFDFPENIARWETDFISSSFDARIIYNCRKPEYIRLLIYYQQAEGLYERLKYLYEDNINILQSIRSVESENCAVFNDKIDFSNSSLIEIKGGFKMELCKMIVELTIDNLDIISHHIIYPQVGHFRLTENALPHIIKYIEYERLENFKHDFKLVNNKSNKRIYFGVAKIELSINHHYSREEDNFKFAILRDAYLLIYDETNNLSDRKIIEYGKLICMLMSLYWQTSIGFFIADVRSNDTQNYYSRKLLRHSRHSIDKDTEFPRKSRYNTFYDFIEELDYDKVVASSKLLCKIVPRLVEAKVLDEISEFMILYNIIEKIRNHCMAKNKNKIQDKFNFTLKGEDLNDFIRSKIREISSIVDESEREEFELKAIKKVKSFTYRSLIDQFSSLIVYLGLQTDLYGLDFNKLIKIRNRIYHGKKCNADFPEINNNMRNLIYDLILRLLQ
jgi:hypothetical protein